MADIERVLITGGCGFIGANLVRYLRERTQWSLRVLDDLRAGGRADLNDGLADVVVGDVSDRETARSALQGVDAVIHLAAQTGVAPSLEDPERDFWGNAAATFSMLESCRRMGVGRLVFASSGAALGDVEPPLHENLVPRPLSPYGAGKLAGEAYCCAYAGSFGMHTVALRFANVYGPFSRHKPNAVPLFITRALRGEALEIYGDGSQTRDFIYVEDLCEGVHRALTAEGAAGEVFQLGTGVETSVRRLAETVQNVLGGTEVVFKPARTGEVRRSRVDVSKARSMLSFEATVQLGTGVERTARWFRSSS
ncbi:MAG: NAD-dependent epimerase/dehydratase family protein [Actinomycetota bacterium]|nr:NAD-dependent epimerase/dehydratase family protein [Actinomycetota bacterium]